MLKGSFCDSEGENTTVSIVCSEISQKEKTMGQFNKAHAAFWVQLFADP